MKMTVGLGFFIRPAVTQRTPNKVPLPCSNPVSTRLAFTTRSSVGRVIASSESCRPEEAREFCCRAKSATELGFRPFHAVTSPRRCFDDLFTWIPVLSTLDSVGRTRSRQWNRLILELLPIRPS